MKFLKKELTAKKTIGKIVFDALLFAVILSLVLYLDLDNFNSSMLELFEAIADGEISAFRIVLILFPIVFIVPLGLELATFVIDKEEK